MGLQGACDAVELVGFGDSFLEDFGEGVLAQVGSPTNSEVPGCLLDRNGRLIILGFLAGARGDDFFALDTNVDAAIIIPDTGAPQADDISGM